MAIEMWRDFSSNRILMAIDDFIHRQSEAELAREMADAIDKFVNTDPECRILINEMVKKTFSEINLLEIVTQAVKSKVDELATGAASSQEKEK